MVGLIHRTLFSLVESAAGNDAVVEVQRRAGVPRDKVFRMDQAYDDAEWQRLLAAACEVLGVTQPQAEQAFAEFFLRDALKRWPRWFAMSRSAREFLERQPKIHNSVATGVRDPATRRAIEDKFRVDSRDGELVVHYKSSNQLCGLYQALARCIIAHFGDKATIDEVRCMKNGDPECEIHIRWPKAGGE
jgi:predicted hydrocarbon binding protein